MTRRILTIAISIALAAGCKPKTKATEPGEPAGPGKNVEDAVEDETDEAAPPSEDEATGNKKVVMIIACKNFRDEELSEPRKALESAGAEVTVASTSREGCKGMMGMQITPDTMVGDLDADEFDAAVFVGGTGSAALYDDGDVLEFAKAADTEGLVIGAICLAPGILARAGILKGLKATSYDSPAARKAFEEGGATWTGEKVTVDGVVVTANGPEAASEFGAKLVELIEK